MKKTLGRKEQNRRRRVQRMVIASSVAVIIFSLSMLATGIANYMRNGEKATDAAFLLMDEEKIEELTLVMVGDNLLHMPLVRNAETQGGYNFDSLYSRMKPHFESADLAVIVQETVLGGKTLGYSGYPLFNSPQEVGDSLVHAGFDIVLHATNHTLDQGVKGVENTLEYWKKHPETTVLGIHESQEDYDSVDYVEQNGIKLAVLNYTDSTNGMSVPENKSYLISKVDEDKIKKDLKTAEENADFTIVFMHWGTEYRLTADEGQKALAQMMCENGADLIMGSHPHVIEPVEWVEAENGNKTLVFYSLGNYVSRQKEATNLLGIMGGVKICSSKEKGTYIDSASVMPIVTHYDTRSRGFDVYPLKDYTDDLASKHGVAQYDGKVSVERFKTKFNSVFGDNTVVTIID